MDELKQAAERCQGFALPGWFDPENASVECVADLFTLARAYLAEHDETAVTLDLLKACLFEEIYTGCFTLRNVSGMALTCTFNLDWTYTDINDRDASLPAPKTLGRLRTLCRALGIGLNEPPT